MDAPNRSSPSKWPFAAYHLFKTKPWHDSTREPKRGQEKLLERSFRVGCRVASSTSEGRPVLEGEGPMSSKEGDLLFTALREALGPYRFPRSFLSSGTPPRFQFRTRGLWDNVQRKESGRQRGWGKAGKGTHSSNSKYP